MSATNYAAARAAERAANDKAEALEIAAGMVETVQAQDKVVEQIAGMTRRGIDEVKRMSDVAVDDARGAREMARRAGDETAILRTEFDEFTHMTLLERLTWLFRGQV